ncbi:LexA family protein [Butyricicoccus sp. AM27-36]|uniref:LexA family protein n=1 Tax=Butyricicoccus sp. AM27-36 TaxID=2292293 RepID=UPI000E480F1D|nr:S24 family peptidase [Butyricicoccus sp. AM27-36]RHT89929.1 helix-turn-helix domain-containing protein [Butyricicoccus sp. AM27-36]
MDTIASRLRAALEMRGMKQAELVELTGIGKSSISTYLRGSYIPKQKNIYKMAKALNVNEAWLMGEDVDPTRQNAYSEPSDSSLVTIHYAGPVAAHFDATPDDAYEQRTIPAQWIGRRRPEDFFLATVSGDSMYPQFQDGDEILCLRCSDMGISGRIGIMLLGGDEATVKRIEYKPGEDWIDLIPINPEFKPRRIEGVDLEQCRVVGRVIKVIRTVDLI